ncbi:GNAT family N-acetyltransferase [Roseovarius sp. CAU 1744]|uniref:GNAT family N-acetyltransferase n=2 Tax=unclassified Roseovarius TaxID=2614913 RepID=UPI0009DFFECA
MTCMEGQNDICARLMCAADGSALAELHRSAILNTSSKFYSDSQRKSWATGLTTNGYMKAVQNGETIEVAVATEDVPVAFCGRREFGITGLFVLPEWQGNGIGSFLLQRAEKALRKNGMSLLRVDAVLPAVSFYERHQYNLEEKRVHKTRGGVEIQILRMTKNILILNHT